MIKLINIYRDRSEIITFFYVFPVKAILWRNCYQQRDPFCSSNETKSITRNIREINWKENTLNFYEDYW